MSWETLVTGSLRFKKSVTMEKKEEVLKGFERELEAKVRWDRRWKEYSYQDVNWGSHVSLDNVKKVFDKYKEFISTFDASLYFLSEVDESIHYDEKVNNGKCEVNGF